MTVVAVSKFELQNSLKPVFAQVDQKKEAALSTRNILNRASQEFVKEAKENPWSTAFKVVLIGLTIAALHPLVLSAIACFNAYRVEDWNDLYSSDLEVSNQASQLFSNLGHGPAYLVEAAELLAFSSRFLFWNSYKRVVGEVIENVYQEYVTNNPQLTARERNFLFARKDRELLILSL